jgi:hypothetical protein
MNAASFIILAAVFALLSGLRLDLPRNEMEADRYIERLRVKNNGVSVISSSAFKRIVVVLEVLWIVALFALLVFFYFD